VTAVAPAAIELNLDEVMKTEMPEFEPPFFGNSLPQPTAGKTPARSERPTATLVAYFNALS
jgi:hypothetical protein